MKHKWLFVSIGFALFSMFFGSGNLVFPITVGQESGGHYLLAATGILFTGVFVPFLGVLGMMLFKGDIYSFFRCLGRRGTFLFSFLALALMGPFGVLARCLTVAHGALLLLIPEASLPLTSLLFCIIIYYLAVNKSKIVSTSGKVLTPFLLVSIAIIAFFGLTQGSTPEATDLTNGWQALKNGFFQGYQTMDLLAAFFFSQFVINHLREMLPDEKSEATLLKHFYKSSLLGAGLLSSVYFALVMLGWMYSPILFQVPPQEMLGMIAIESLGSIAAPCVCLAILFACLTTGIVLASLFADFLCAEVTKNKIGTKLSLLITLGIGFVVSTFDFAGIAKFLGPMLETIYPALITLTVFNVASKLLGFKFPEWLYVSKQNERSK
ncbi:MAG: branched-chain amino acid transport system II carrier protein [Parachlamydiaceae bacterium]|nr:branched-chain amino acid transport system II carrier protein [Parachlamydiaceae bacterium]